MPMMNAPKITAMPISSVANADSRMPAKIATIQPPGTRPASSKASDARASSRRTTISMNAVNAIASAIVLSTSEVPPCVATAVARAIRNQAVTSSIAAHASVSAPTGRFSIRRSTRMRASTGNAVIDIATPMNSANAMNFLSGPTSV